VGRDNRWAAAPWDVPLGVGQLGAWCPQGAVASLEVWSSAGNRSSQLAAAAGLFIALKDDELDHTESELEVVFLILGREDCER